MYTIIGGRDDPNTKHPESVAGIPAHIQGEGTLDHMQKLAQKIVDTLPLGDQVSISQNIQPWDGPGDISGAQGSGVTLPKSPDDDL